MVQPLQPTSNVPRDIGKGILTGTGITVFQTPLANAINRVSIIGCRDNVSMRKAAERIYRGTADGVSHRSLSHFNIGVEAHLFKEMVRVAAKSAGLSLKPRIDAYFSESHLGKQKADLAFSGSLSLAEMAIQPADTIRVMWQAKKLLKDIPQDKRLSHLYKGATANGTRQFFTWLLYSKQERFWSQAVSQLTPLDPASMSGIFLKSFPMSACITPPVWIFECLKNHLQMNPQLTGAGNKTSRYMAAFRHVLTTQGLRGFGNGLIAKTYYNAYLAMGANWILEQAREAQKAKR